MSESYFQRKLFSRMKRIRTQASFSWAKSMATDVGLTKSSRSSPSMLASSISTPQLHDMLRQDANSEDDHCSRSMPSTGEAGEQEIEAEAETERGADRDSDAAYSSTHKPRTRLKVASKAILFFRRAASNLTSNASSSNNTTHDSHFVVRQNTGDSCESQPSSTSGHQHHQRGHYTHPSLASHSTNEVTQFIVPKMNALKLPLVCRIKSVDGELMREVFVHRYELGQYLIESLKVSLGLNDCKYFGLKIAKSPDDQEDLRNVWLDLNESVCKQIKNIKGLIQQQPQHQHHQPNYMNNGGSMNSGGANCNNTSSSSSIRSIDFYLRIKFYPPNLARVQDSFLRHYLWIQLRRDLRLGKLTSSMNNLTLLMACVLQCELGDYRTDFVKRVPELNILPNQDLIEEKAVELWRRRLIGTKKHQAQMQFLRAAVILETYGFDYYPVRDHQRQRAYLLGFNYAGIKTIRNGGIVHHFRWHSLSKISYERRMMIFHVYPSENSKRKQTLGFKCLSNEDCQNLYMRLLEQKYFFTVDLAYFDKSVRRPSCLYTAVGGASQQLDRWASLNDHLSPHHNHYHQQPQQQQQQHSRIQNNEVPNFESFTDVGAESHRHWPSTSSGFWPLDEHQSSKNSSSSLDEDCGRANDCPSLVKSLSLQEEGSIKPAAAGQQQPTRSSGYHGDHRMAATREQEKACGLRQSTRRYFNPKRAASSPQVSNLQRRQSARQYFFTRHQTHETPAAASASVLGENRDQILQKSQSSFENRQVQQSKESLETAILGRKHATVDSNKGWWTKVVSCIRLNCGPSGGVRQRLVQFTESILIQPISTTTSQWQPQQQEPVSSRWTPFMSAFRFVMVILILNVLLKMTDNFSDIIIELLTLSPQSHASTISQRQQLTDRQATEASNSPEL